ncbi:MAG TPA: choice-of-anchor P family protein [Rhodanobacteraceae bacterium]|nr:choice-of-anchor P family protein [Rhodanobacteraceae bacterium]
MLGMAAAPAAHAQTGSANAADVSVHIDLLGVAQLDVDPLAPAGFANATDPTYQQNSLPSYDSGGTLLHLATGSVSAEAQYSPSVSFSIAGANDEIHDLSLSAVSILGDELLSIGANLIHVQSQVAGYCLPTRRQSRGVEDVGDTLFFSSFDAGNLSAGDDGLGSPGDDVTFDGLGISIMGTPVPGLPTNPPPNTTVDLGALGIGGATLVLNERVVTGDGVNTLTLSTNGVHLTLDEAGLVIADVVLAHSDSAIDCTQ